MLLCSYYLFHRETAAHPPVPAFLVETPADEKTYAATFKLKNAVRRDKAGASIRRK